MFLLVSHAVSRRAFIFLACMPTQTGLCLLPKCSCPSGRWCTICIEIAAMHAVYCLQRCQFLSTAPCLSLQDEDVDITECFQGGNMCAVCHHTSTCDYEVERVRPPPPEKARRRRYGDFSMAGDPLQWVYPLCHIYMSPDTNVVQPSTWSCAWPAVLWPILSGRFRTDPQRAVQMLPLSLRAMWSRTFRDMAANVQHLWHDPPVFADTTSTLTAFKAIFAECRIMPLMRWLDDNSFPSVKCPLGCSIFIDDLEWGTATLIPVSHYLRTIFPLFTSFGADATQLAGARPDWPNIHDSLSWSVAPSLVVDTKAGLSFVTCSAAHHAPPNHPTSGLLGPLVTCNHIPQLCTL